MVNYTIPSANLLHSYWKWWKNGPVEIVDLPINSMVIFHSSVSLPEGTQFQSFGSNSYRYEWDQMRLALGELSEDDNITVDQILGQ